MRPVGNDSKANLSNRLPVLALSLALAVIIGAGFLTTSGQLQPLDDASTAHEVNQKEQTSSLLAASARSAGEAAQMAAAATMKISSGMVELLKRTVTDSLQFGLKGMIAVGDVVVADYPVYTPPSLQPQVSR